jgi:hypothetical protein
VTRHDNILARVDFFDLASSYRTVALHLSAKNTITDDTKTRVEETHGLKDKEIIFD